MHLMAVVTYDFFLLTFSIRSAEYAFIQVGVHANPLVLPLCKFVQGMSAWNP